MPKEYFSVDRSSGLSELSPGSKIHVIGVCGVAMAQLAVALSEMGFVVSGSDKEFYEPMGSLLARSAVRCHRGFEAAHLSADLSLVVVGNAVSYENTEVQALEALRLPYTLFPRLLFDTVIRDKHSIVVSGTHGKSTTSAMGAFVLTRLGRDPGYFVGGIARDLDLSLRRGAGRFSVVEGDEYDSAFFAKVPKFSFYAPDTLIVTSVEYDHADIYPTLESINAEFDRMVKKLTTKSSVIACLDDSNLASLVQRWKREASCPLVTYGTDAAADWRILSVSEEAGVQRAQVKDSNGTQFEMRLQLPGLYNAKNALSILIALERNGIPRTEVLQSLTEFRGVRRRQEVRAEAGGIVVVEDFAHHPTAVRETLQGIRARYPAHRLVAVFEPRSATSRRTVFQADYVHAFAAAAEVVLCEVAGRALDGGQALLDVKELAQEIAASGVSARSLPDAGKIAEFLAGHVQAGDVVVVMSNGSFGGLIEELVGQVSGG